MKIEVEAVSPVEKKVTVEVDPERVAKELDVAYASLGRRVKLRGFRTGKVPRNVLERNFKDEVERDVAEKLVSASFGDAMREHAIEA
ncbi:MAG TPA: trigger factor family protein, partial [Anaeromyxobacteraceae bacterium]